MLREEMCTDWTNRIRIKSKKGKGSPYSTAEHRVPEVIPVLDSQPSND